MQDPIFIETRLSSAEPGLSITLFGTFNLRRNGQSLPPTRTRKEQWLLALLILHPSAPTDRSLLAASLWPDSDDTQALGNLRRSLNNLRHVLGDDAHRIMAPTPRTIAFHLADVTCDLTAFDAAMQAGDRASLKHAVTLHGGPLLQGCDADWLAPHRAVREEQYRHALEVLAHAAVAQDEPQEAIRYLRLLLTADPLRETALRLLMQALAGRGEFPAVTQAYRDFRIHLHRELNAELDAETIALYKELTLARRASVTASPARTISALPAPCRLPHPLTELIGRDRETQAILAALQSARLLTLAGAGGIGKTRLSVAVAREALPDFADGAWFVDLAPISDPELVWRTAAARLEVREETHRDLRETLIEHLRARRLLLVLDNCEHLLSSCATLADALLAACPHLKILATSRQPLGLTGEIVRRVPSLALPVVNADAAFDVSRLLESDAARLFVERAKQASAAFALTPDNALFVAQICHRLDGIPLALELAAARTNVLPVEQIAVRLDQAFTLLRGGSRTALPRHQTLRGLLDWSYDLLPEAERVLLRRCAIFTGGWTLEAAESICADEETTAAGEILAAGSVLELLSELVDKSLVSVDADCRFRLLETVRQYGEEKLWATAEAEPLRRRHTNYFLRFADTAVILFNSGDEKIALDDLEREHDNLREAIAWCRERNEAAEQEVRLVSALGQFWYLRGYVQEGQGYLLRAIGHAGGQSASYALGRALHHAGWMAHFQQDYVAAWKLFERSLSVFREIGSPEGIAQSLNRLGCVALETQKYEQAQGLLEEARTLFHDMNNTRNLAFVLNNLGTLSEERSDTAAARHYYEEGLAAARDCGGEDVTALILSNLGAMHCRINNPDAAQSLLMESLCICRATGDRPRLHAVLSGLMWAAVLQGGNEQAAHLHGSIMALSEMLGIRSVTEDDEEYQEVIAQINAALDAETFARAFAGGYALHPEQMITAALQIEPEPAFAVASRE